MLSSMPLSLSLFYKTVSPRLRAFGSYIRTDGLAPALRCANDLLWLVWLGQTGEVTFSRPFHPLERLALQGFSPEMGRRMHKKACVLLLPVACNHLLTLLVESVMSDCEIVVIGKSISFF